MLKTPTVERIPIQDHEFYRKIRMESESDLERCYQCYTCSNACPVAYTMDYLPHQLIHMVQLGLKETVLQSRTIWICVSCETCATRCPNQIDIVRLMDVLRKESLQEGFKSPVNEIPQFHKVFVEEIQKMGRVHELTLVLRYKIKTGDLLSFKKIRADVSLGLKMFIKGKLKFLPYKMRGQKEVKGLFKKVFSVSKI